MTKTCGECKHFNKDYSACSVNKRTLISRRPNRDACEMFEPQVITNGDKIIAGGMRAIAEFALHHCCNNCIYFDGNNPYRSTCGKPDNETCEDGVEAWLNAPAESEGGNG